MLVPAMDEPIWETGSWSPLPLLEGSTTADVCVVGLGGSGLAAIAEAVAQGLDVVGIDASSVAAGAAGRNGGFLLAGLAGFFHRCVDQLGGELAAGLYQRTIEELARMEAEHGARVGRNGSLRIAAGAEELADCAEHLQALRRHGFPAEPYSGPEGEGLLIPTDGTFQPLDCTRAEAAAVRRGGARLFERTAASELRRGRVVTERGTISCGVVVVAVDGGLERVLPELAPRVRTARLQMLATAPAPDVRFPRPVYWRHGYEYWQQLANGAIALGGFRDRGGEAEWTHLPVPGGVVQELLEDFLRRRVRTSATIVRRWAGCVAYTGDGLPVLEAVREGVYAAGAYSGTGNIVGRLCGRAAARLALGAKSQWAELLQRARAEVQRRRPWRASPTLPT
jgi:gamma-glutamylputrescine oxidase